jgi:hypothetical protein
VPEGCPKARVRATDHICPHSPVRSRLLMRCSNDRGLSGIWLLNHPKNTSASANRSGDTNLRMAVALVNGTRSIVVPCKATIWPEWP